jgi:hypothetical protein
MELTDILLDLQQTSFDVALPLPPYDEDDTFREKFNKTWKKLQRHLQCKDRLLSLVNSFYLGELLDQIPNLGERCKYKRRISQHYATMVERTFDIFEYCPQQLMKTQTLTVQVVKKLTRPQVTKIREEMIFFDGTQRIEEEAVIPGSSLEDQ